MPGATPVGHRKRTTSALRQSLHRSAKRGGRLRLPDAIAWPRREVRPCNSARPTVALAAALFLLPTVCDAAPRAARPGDKKMQIWYARPAGEWVEALPIGNGRLGAMVFGGTAAEHLQFNENTLWTGQPHEYQHPGAVEHLPDHPPAAGRGQAGRGRGARDAEFMSVPLRQKAYQPFGDLRLDFPGHDTAADYRRELDLDSAVACGTATASATSPYEREVFASHPDQRDRHADQRRSPGHVAFTASWTSPHPDATRRVAPTSWPSPGRCRRAACSSRPGCGVVPEGGPRRCRRRQEVARRGGRRRHADPGRRHQLQELPGHQRRPGRALRAKALAAVGGKPFDALRARPRRPTIAASSAACRSTWADTRLGRPADGRAARGGRAQRADPRWRRCTSSSAATC